MQTHFSQPSGKCHHRPFLHAREHHARWSQQDLRIRAWRRWALAAPREGDTDEYVYAGAPWGGFGWDMTFKWPGQISARNRTWRDPEPFPTPAHSGGCDVGGAGGSGHPTEGQPSHRRIRGCGGGLPQLAVSPSFRLGAFGPVSNNCGRSRPHFGPTRPRLGDLGRTRPDFVLVSPRDSHVDPKTLKSLRRPPHD